MTERDEKIESIRICLNNRDRVETYEIEWLLDELAKADALVASRTLERDDAFKEIERLANLVRDERLKLKREELAIVKPQHEPDTTK